VGDNEQRKALPVKMVGAGVDAPTQASVSISEIHHFIHLGIFFSAWAINDALSNNSVIDMLIDPNNAVPHIRGIASIGGNGRFTLYEAPTVSNNGNAITAFNKNRMSSNTAQTQLFLGPTVSSTGTAIMDRLVEGGTGSGIFSTATGGESSIFEEYVLNRDRLYLMRLRNISGATRIASINLDFYELP
jgi:hypothetical protein